MIHYHGTPITPATDAAAILSARHAMVSFANPQQVELIFECCQSAALDNGAFPMWRAGLKMAGFEVWNPYYEWVGLWQKHPSFDFALIPDVIDGTEKDNDDLIAVWPFSKMAGCPVWHLHESLPKLQRLCEFWPRVAIGSSGEYAQIGTDRWWNRMGEAMNLVCPFGYPLAKLHGLRMLDTEIFSRFPFSSADSTNVARNIGIDQAWRGTYQPANKSGRGVVIANRIESVNSASVWAKMDTQPRMTFESAS